MEVAEGIAIVAAALLVVFGTGYLGLRSPFDHGIFRRHLGYPLSLLCVLLSGVGALCFDDLVLCNFKELDHFIDLNGWNLTQYPLSLFGYLGGSAMGEGGRLGYGALALTIWGLTLLALSLGRGFRVAVKVFALPSILFLTMVVFLFDPGEMDSQAVNLASGLTLDGVSLVSNWSLLTVSLFFTVFEVARSARRRDGTKPGSAPLTASFVRAVRRPASNGRVRRETRAPAFRDPAEDQFV